MLNNARVWRQIETGFPPAPLFADMDVGERVEQTEEL
jgi:hypothetical protein